LGRLPQDASLQGGQGRARVKAEFGGEQRPGAADRVEGLGLAPAAVQREREQPPRLLAPRVPADVGLQVRHGLGREAEREPRRCLPFDKSQPQFCQPGAFGAGPRLVRELGVCGSPPQGEGCVAQVKHPGRRSGSRLSGQPLEPERVEVAGLGPQRVSRVPRHQELEPCPC
jgi:hypothetical protein